MLSSRPGLGFAGALALLTALVAEACNGSGAAQDPPPPPPAPAALSPDTVVQVLRQTLELACQPPLTERQLLARFAPGGAARAGGIELGGRRPFYIKNDVVTSLRLFAPFDFVVWWMNPADEKTPAKEVHLALDSSARVVPYDSFVAAMPTLGAGQAEAQTHPLSDIRMEHRIACQSGQTARVVIHRIVWAEPFVGKIGEIAIYN